MRVLEFLLGRQEMEPGQEGLLVAWRDFDSWLNEHYPDLCRDERGRAGELVGKRFVYPSQETEFVSMLEKLHTEIVGLEDRDDPNSLLWRHFRTLLVQLVIRTAETTRYSDMYGHRVRVMRLVRAL